MCYITSRSRKDKQKYKIHDVQEVWSKWSFNLENKLIVAFSEAFIFCQLVCPPPSWALHCIVITEWGAGILTRFLQVKIIPEVIFKLQSAIILTEVNF